MKDTFDEKLIELCKPFSVNGVIVRPEVVAELQYSDCGAGVYWYPAIQKWIGSIYFGNREFEIAGDTLNGVANDIKSKIDGVITDLLQEDMNER